MKYMILAALAALTLSAGVASAQGVPPGYNPPAYGSAWASDKMAADKARDAALARLSQEQAPKTANTAASSSANGS
jgi:hypothetical protein